LQQNQSALIPQNSEKESSAQFYGNSFRAGSGRGSPQPPVASLKKGKASPRSNKGVGLLADGKNLQAQQLMASRPKALAA